MIGLAAERAAPITSKQSYIDGIVAQERFSPVFHGTSKLRLIKQHAD